jgi:hypothetical protein
MSRRRTKLRIVPDRPPARSKLATGLWALLSGVAAGAATTGALKYYLASRRARGARDRDEVGVIHAEVQSNGHSKSRLGSLDSFS